MIGRERLIITVSPRGQVVLPKGIRERHKWEAGTRLMVEDTPDGVLLRRAAALVATRPEDVYRSLPFAGKPKTVEEMDAAVHAEARRRRARG